MTFEEEMEAEVLSSEAIAKIRAGQSDLARKDIQTLTAAETTEQEFYALPRAALAYLTINEPGLAKSAAIRALELCKSFDGDWNFGNAIHNCNVVLGVLALESGDRESALAHLHSAGQTPGSPQLASFGPNMQLAKRLLLVGEFDEVASYLSECERFWTHGENWLRIWIRKVQSQEVPNFYMHLYV